MRIALVHELLTMRGGAEQVLKVLADMFPDAPIYTLLYDKKKLGDWFPAERIRPAKIVGMHLLPHFQFSIFNFQFRNNHHLYLSQFPKAVEQWDFSEFDLVISSSSAFAHGIITNGKPKHLCYVHSPARYLWDRTHDVLEQASKGLLGPLKRWYLERTFHKLRIWDAEAAYRPDKIIAASKEVQRRIELYWRQPSDVLYPPIDDFWLQDFRSPKSEVRSVPRSLGEGRSPYFIIASTLARYKRIDLAIQACNQLKLTLKIVGEGPDRRRLEKLAGSTIEFLGYQSHDQLRELYANAQATIFPGEEDFGLVPLESMACGTPVIAYRKGGALETIIDGKTGMFFDEPTAESLAKKLQSFKKNSFSPDDCRKQTEKFSRKKFEEGIQAAIASL